MKTNIALVLLFISFIAGLTWVAIGSEIYYFKTTQYSLYTIEIELLTGSKDTIQVRAPKGIHYQINCHSNKGYFNGCNLESIPKNGELYNFLGGHWGSVRDGVISYKILSKKIYKY